MRVSRSIHLSLSLTQRAIGALLIYSGGAKTVVPGARCEFDAVVRSLHLPDSLRAVLLNGLGPLEIAVGICLLVGFLRQIHLSVSVCLMAAFVGATAMQSASGFQDRECGCGLGTSVSVGTALVRNSILLALLCGCLLHEFWAGKSPVQPPGS